MRRLAIHLLFAALCFSAGLLAHHFWHIPTPSTKVSKPLDISICELELDPERYNDGEVRVKALLYGDLMGEPYMVDESCGSPNRPLTKMITVSVETKQAFSVMPTWATYTSFCANDTYAATVAGLSAEVVLVGTYNSRPSRITPRSVIQLSPASR